METFGLKIFFYDVGKNVRAPIADVDMVIDRRATGIHANLFIVQWGKLIDRSGQGVIKTYIHIPQYK